jgi:hypothetical protein
VNGGIKRRLLAVNLISPARLKMRVNCDDTHAAAVVDPKNRVAKKFGARKKFPPTKNSAAPENFMWA